MTTALLLCALALLPLAVHAATNDLSAALQTGLFEEEANRNLPAAIESYEKVAKQFDQNRALAATAIFRLGEVNRKLGKTNEAAAFYQRILRDFGDQDTLAKLSQQNLAGMGMGGGRPSDRLAAVISRDAPASNEAAQLAQQIAAIEDLKANPEKQARTVQAMFPDDDLKKMLLGLPRLEEQVATFKTDPAAKLDGFVFARRAGGSVDLLDAGASTPKGLPEAQAELQKQLQYISERVNFILGLQKERLQFLQSLAAGGAAENSAKVRSEALGTLEADYFLLQAQINAVRTETNLQALALLANQLGDKTLATSAGFLEEAQVTRDAEGIRVWQNTLKLNRADALKPLESRLRVLEAAIAQARKGGKVDPVSSAPITAVLDEEETEIRRIQAMIQNSPDLIDAPAQAQDGLTPLYRAATAGRLRVARFLLDNGADINARLVLHGAAEWGHKAMVELLLSRGADVQRQNPEGQTPLHLAARKGFATVVQTLVANGAEVNAKDKTGTTPLHLAVVAAHGATAAQLLAKGADVNAQANDGETALIRAARAGHSAMVEQLLSAKADVNHQDEDGRTALSYAAEKGHSLVIKAMLAAKADPNAGKGNLPLHCAIKNESTGNVEALLKAGADANRSSTLSWTTSVNPYPQTYGSAVTPLAVAMDKPQLQIIKLLLAHKADPDGKSTSGAPLIFSAVKNAELMKAFLDAGANPNVDDGSTDQQRSPLLVAGNPQVVTLLLAAKANSETRHRNICDRNELGMTPLQLWTSSCWTLSDPAGMVEALLKGGAEVDARTAAGTTALHQAAANKNKELMTLLIAHKADVNARDNAGLTPLDYAQGRNQAAGAMVGFSPAPPALPGPGGRPVSTAPKSASESVVELLRQHGGLADLPKLDRIEVTRPDTGYRATAFLSGTNGWNQFTLAEVLAQQWGLLSAKRSGTWEKQRSVFRMNIWQGNALRFPDLSRIKIHSPAKNGSVRATVNADLTLRDDQSGNFRNYILQMGDVVEVPEADHPVNETWLGLVQPDFQAFSNAITRTVAITVSGKTTNVTLAPVMGVADGYSPNNYSAPTSITTPSFMLRSVLDESKLIRSSSDLTRVKVTRRESANTKPRVWVVDCSVPDKAPDLWLRDGDVIEVPEK